MRQTMPAAVEVRPGEIAEGNRIWFAQILRGLACLTVVATHLQILIPTTPRIPLSLGLFPTHVSVPSPGFLLYNFLGTRQIFPGQVAVALLFLISGFVIPISLRRHTLGGFFVRRFFRVYPMLWVTQVVLLAVLIYRTHADGIPFPFDKTTLALNGFLVSSYFNKPLLEGVYWTLYVEEMFYIIGAFCAWRGLLDKRPAILLIGLGMAGLTVGIGTALHSGHGLRWQTPFYLLGFNLGFAVFVLLGVVLHHLYFGIWRLRSGITLLICLLGLYTACVFRGPMRDATMQRVHYLGGVVGLALFVSVLCVNRWLPYSRWLDRLANISYPLYLIHYSCGTRVLEAVRAATGSLYLGMAVALVVVLLLAALLHHVVERPAMNLGRRLADRLRRRPDQEKPTGLPLAA